MDWTRFEREWAERRAAMSMLLDDHSAVMTRAEFSDLDEYSCSLPTGTPIGKIWKAYRGDACWLGEYVPDPNPGYVGIN